MSLRPLLEKKFDLKGDAVITGSHTTAIATINTWTPINVDNNSGNDKYFSSGGNTGHSGSTAVVYYLDSHIKGRALVNYSIHVVTAKDFSIQVFRSDDSNHTTYEAIDSSIFKSKGPCTAVNSFFMDLLPGRRLKVEIQNNEDDVDLVIDHFNFVVDGYQVI